MKHEDYILLSKNSVFIDKRAKIGKNAIIYENNRIDGESIIGDNVTIFPNSFIANTIIGKGSKIYSSVIENSKIGDRCIVLPFVYLKRSSVDSGVIVPAFSEVKQKKITKDSFKKL